MKSQRLVVDHTKWDRSVMGRARVEVLRKVFPYVEVLGQKDGDSKFQARGYRVSI